MAHNRPHCRLVLNTLVNLLVPYNALSFIANDEDCNYVLSKVLVVKFSFAPMTR